MDKTEIERRLAVAAETLAKFTLTPGSNHNEFRPTVASEGKAIVITWPDVWVKVGGFELVSDSYSDGPYQAVNSSGIRRLWYQGTVQWTVGKVKGGGKCIFSHPNQRLETLKGLRPEGLDREHSLIQDCLIRLDRTLAHLWHTELLAPVKMRERKYPEDNRIKSWLKSHF